MSPVSAIPRLGNWSIFCGNDALMDTKRCGQIAGTVAKMQVENNALCSGLLIVFAY